MKKAVRKRLDPESGAGRDGEFLDVLSASASDNG